MPFYLFAKANMLYGRFSFFVNGHDCAQKYARKKKERAEFLLPFLKLYYFITFTKTRTERTIPIRA